MKILVANLGSTSFKFRLFEMESEDQIARGSVENIGELQSDFSIQTLNDASNGQRLIHDHAAALELCLEQLKLLGIEIDSAAGSFAIGFKAVHGGKYSQVELIDESVICEMELLSKVAPAHNPPYTKAMRLLKQRFPDIPQVAAFETGFHIDAPIEHKTYAIPHEWTEELHVTRSGFHGASHRYIAERMQTIAPECSRVISCHLGGSSSICAIKNGKSLGATMGFSPQGGLPQSNRCGDFDPFAIPHIMERTGKNLDEVLTILSRESGLKGISGVSADLRLIIDSASHGDKRSQLALDVYVAETRRHLGGMIMRLNGVEAIVFTGGIGERSELIRSRVCQTLDELGIVLDMDLNKNADGEVRVECQQKSRVQIWVVPTNEEIVVARQTAAMLEKNNVCR